MEVNKLEGKTLDGVSENVSTLAQAFPEVIVDGKVDFEKLRLILGEDIEDAEERYSFTWPGKRDAIKLAISRTTGTLRPDKENSKDWDTTQNLFIEGDNLEVLRVLQNTYRGKVKMIYIDPPYNTGNDFVYKDDFKDNIANYKEQAGLGGQSNADTSGRFHSNWLNMMYPRLRLAKNLLRDDGVIFISIDDNEVHNLRKICEDIFGAENFIGTIARKTKLTSNKGTFFAPSHEYIHVFANKIHQLGQFNDDEAQADPSYIKLFKYEDNYSKYNIVGLYQPSLDSRPNQRYYIKCPDGSFVIPPGSTFPSEVGDAKFVKPNGNSDKVWRWSFESYLKYDKSNLVFKETSTSPLLDEHGNQSKWNVYTKIYLKDRLRDGARPVTLMTKYTNSEASKELINLNIPFDFSKPKNLIKYLMKIQEADDKNYIVLDFFSGSGTTAHSTIALNAEDGGTRRFIMVQLPEVTPDNSEAKKSGLKTIPEISRKRISVAGDKVKTDFADKLKERTTSLDVGFKAFKLDTTNFREWDTDTEDINASLLAALDTFKEGRTNEDALYEVLLKYGVDLTEPVDVITLAGKQVYSLAGNYLLVCLEKHISLAIVEEMAKLNPSRVVCYDDGFENDEVKQNALETLKRAGVEDVRVI